MEVCIRKNFVALCFLNDLGQKNVGLGLAHLSQITCVFRLYPWVFHIFSNTGISS